MSEPLTPAAGYRFWFGDFGSAWNRDQEDQIMDAADAIAAANGLTSTMSDAHRKWAFDEAVRQLGAAAWLKRKPQHRRAPRARASRLTQAEITRRREEIALIPQAWQQLYQERHGAGWKRRVLHASPQAYREFIAEVYRLAGKLPTTAAEKADPFAPATPALRRPRG